MSNKKLLFESFGLIYTMEKMKSNTLSWNSQKDVEVARRLLMQNELLVGTSDTILGLLAPLTHEGFVALNAIKGRQEKPYVILVENFQSATKLVENSFQLEKLSAFWPAPLTLVCTARKDLPEWLTSKDGTIAIRVPDHEGLRSLLEGLPGLFSTSANKAGQPVATRIEDIDADILTAVAAIITDDHPPLERASTIVDCTVEPYKVIREGAFDLSMLD